MNMILRASILLILLILVSNPTYGALNCKQLFKAFTRSSQPKSNDNISKDTDTFTHYSYKGSNGHTWTEARIKVHQKILDRVTKDVDKASKVIEASPYYTSNPNQPVLILTRGNSGSGKTYALKNGKNELLDSLSLKSIALNHELGMINPDPIKSIIQNEIHNGELTSNQVHEEGSYLAKVVIAKSLEHGKSIIIDKRFTTMDSLRPTVEKAKELGYKTVLIDVDASIVDSSHRITGRPVGGESPNVPFVAIESGFKESRENRQEIANSKLIDEYILLAGTELIAKKTTGNEIGIVNKKAWKTLTKNSESETLAAEAMYKSILDHLSKTVPEQLLMPFITSQRGKNSLSPENMGFLMRMKDFHYEMKKDSGQVYHERFASAFREYLQYNFKDISIEQTIQPETATRMASIEIKIKTKSKQVAEDLMNSKGWEFEVLESNPQNYVIKFDTRKNSLIRPDEILEHDYDLNKYQFGLSNSKNPRSYSYDFIKNYKELQIEIDPINTIKIDISGMKIRFSNESNFIKYRYGFEAIEVTANLFAAQVELYLSKQSKDSSEQHFNSFKTHLRDAEEFLRIIELGIEKQPGITLKTNNSTKANEINSWVANINETIKLLNKPSDNN